VVFSYFFSAIFLLKTREAQLLRTLSSSFLSSGSTLSDIFKFIEATPKLSKLRYVVINLDIDCPADQMVFSNVCRELEDKRYNFPIFFSP